MHRCLAGVQTNFQIFVRKHATFNDQHNLYNVEVEGDYIYKNKIIFKRGENKLNYRKLTSLELDSLKCLTQKILNKDLHENEDHIKFNPHYYYSIYLKNKNTEKSITIFSDKISMGFKILIDYVEYLSLKGKYSIISPEINGLQDISFGYLINKQDTLLLQPWSAFSIYKALFTANYKREVKYKSNCLHYKYIINFIYPIEYIISPEENSEEMINSISFNRKRIRICLKSGEIYVARFKEKPFLRFKTDFP